MDHFKATLARQKFNQRCVAAPSPTQNSTALIPTQPLRVLTAPMTQAVAHVRHPTKEQLTVSNRLIEQLDFHPEMMTERELLQVPVGTVVLHQDGVARVHSSQNGSFHQVPLFLIGM